MSIKDLLSNQYRYPLPAPPNFFTFEFTTSSIPISADSKYVMVTGMPLASTYSITDPVVQVSMITSGAPNPELQLAGYQNYNPVAGTLEILVNNIDDATSKFLIFVCQKSAI
jgi:hypothetical protein